MVYCIVEGQSDRYILSVVLKKCEGLSVNIIVSDGFPSMPAVARTIMSFMNKGDKVMIVCDEDNFQRGGYGRNMFNFLMRGAAYNPSFQLFTFRPNIDYLISKKTGKDNKWKSNPAEIEKRVNENINTILNDETINKIIAFAKQ